MTDLTGRVMAEYTQRTMAGHANELATREFQKGLLALLGELLDAEREIAKQQGFQSGRLADLRDILRTRLP